MAGAEDLKSLRGTPQIRGRATWFVEVYDALLKALETCKDDRGRPLLAPDKKAIAKTVLKSRSG